MALNGDIRRLTALTVGCSLSYTSVFDCHAHVKLDPRCRSSILDSRSSAVTCLQLDELFSHQDPRRVVDSKQVVFHTGPPRSLGIGRASRFERLPHTITIPLLRVERNVPEGPEDDGSVAMSPECES